MSTETEGHPCHLSTDRGRPDVSCNEYYSIQMVIMHDFSLMCQSSRIRVTVTEPVEIVYAD